MALLDYRKHFLWLIAAVAALLTILTLADSILPAGMRYTAYTALYGVLHGTAVCLALYDRSSVAKQILFVGLAAIASTAAPIVGGSIATLLPTDWGDVGYWLMLVFASLAGAAAYWFLLKLFWFPKLSMKSLALAVTFCAAATPVGFVIASAVTEFGASPSGFADVIPTASWWFAFSISLYLWDRLRLGNEFAPK